MPADNRTVFLEAGEALLVEQATEVTLRSLTVRAITKRARRSTGAFYHYWETQADYVRDLVPYLVRWDAMREGDPAIEHVQRIDPREFNGSLATEVFEQAINGMVETQIGRVQWLLFSMADDPRLASTLQALYRDYVSVFAAEYERVFGALGLRPVDDLTWVDVSVMLAAAHDGLAMRRSIEPERASKDIAARMFAAVVTSVLVPVDAPDVPLLDRLDDLLTRHRPSTLA